ncbi:hypothetical protein vseg_009156 [Gypsophila vaccaria]
MIIENGLSKDIVDIHCQFHDSSDRKLDLGIIHVPLGQNYSITFKSSRWSEFYINCDFIWPNHGHADKLPVFNEDNVSYACGGNTCSWKAADDGIYRFHIMKNISFKEYSWI